ncbi:hypothetical protein [Oscillatoria sp. HE19RPO]|uniref:hypothetical protein n=1 Tax=Oscillatoria sp. HE19RPO TaxID=2954806 RepID=UPI0020C48E75|nr:hypothetical protein [Oscillatoria sp. HE19RPO]
MTIKIFSLRHNLSLFIGAILILGFIPASVHAFSDENPPESNISDEVLPETETETDDPDEEDTPQIEETENIKPPEEELPPDNQTPEESPGETETIDAVEGTPTIEAAPDINQQNGQESTAETEGETSVEIEGETGPESTAETEGETSENVGGSTSEPSINPPIDAPNVEVGFSTEVTNAVNQTAENIIEQSSLSTGQVDISVGDLGAGGGGDSSVSNTLITIVTGSSAVDSANLNVLVQGLLQILGAPSREVAEQLVRSLLGLLKDGKVDPRRLWAAINAYNAFIQASSPEFLENPPIELVMIRALLSDLVEAAIAADIRSRN